MENDNFEKRLLSSPLLFEDESHHVEDLDRTNPSRRPWVDYGLKSSTFRVIGFVVGFVTQVVSLSAYRNLLVDWPEARRPDQTQVLINGGDPHDNQNIGSTLSLYEWVNYFGLQVASKIDLILYFSIWIFVTMTLSRKAWCFCKRIGGRSTKTGSKKGEIGAYFRISNRRVGNVLGINLFVGIVVGNLAAWFLVDSWLGFPVPLGPILGIAIFDAILCWFLIWSFDSFLIDSEEEEH